jgi:PAS domain S-box-containing protein
MPHQASLDSPETVAHSGEAAREHGHPSGRRLSFGYALVLAILLADAALTVSNLRTIAESEGRVGHSRELIVEIDRSLSLLKDAETGQRGYLLTGDPKYLAPYVETSRELDRHQERLAELTADHPLQVPLVAELKSITHAKMEELGRIIALRDESGLAPAIHEVIAGRGQSLMEEARLVTAALRGDEDGRLERRSTAASGALRWAGLSLALTSGTAVALLLYLALLKRQDDAAKRRIEARLRASEARLRALADAMPQIVWAARPDGTVDYLNRRWFETTGLDPASPLEGHDWTSGVHPDDIASVAENWSRALQTRSVFEAEYRLTTGHGGNRWHLGRAVPVSDASGAVIRWYGTATDIDDRKQAEAALIEADRLKDEFLATMAHELRNPLAPVRTALHMLSRDGQDEAERERIRTLIERQVGHLVWLVDDLFDVARITRGRIQLQREPVSLAAAVLHAVETSRPAIEAQDHQIEVALPPPDVRLDADPVRLEQVIVNLLNNAARYTAPGGRIGVSAAREGDAAVVRVCDSGIGIPADLLPTIFEPFVQGQRRLDRASGGLGIGLGLVKSLVTLHGGTVAARSDGPGQGSEFEVRFPALPEETPAPPALAPVSPASLDRPPRRILIVDDNVDAAESLAHLLRRFWKQDVRVVHDGNSALGVADEFRPELVLLDLGMPGMDGFEVARRLRSHHATAGSLLVALTGWGGDDERRRAREAGFDLHLVKPVEPQVFGDLLIHPTRSSA